MGSTGHLVEDCPVGTEEIKLGEDSVSHRGADMVELAVRLRWKNHNWQAGESDPLGPHTVGSDLLDCQIV